DTCVYPRSRGRCQALLDPLPREDVAGKEEVQDELGHERVHLGLDERTVLYDRAAACRLRRGDRLVEAGLRPRKPRRVDGGAGERALGVAPDFAAPWAPASLRAVHVPVAPPAVTPLWRPARKPSTSLSTAAVSPAVMQGGFVSALAKAVVNV